MEMWILIDMFVVIFCFLGARRCGCLNVFVLYCVVSLLVLMWATLRVATFSMKMSDLFVYYRVLKGWVSKGRG